MKKQIIVVLAFWALQTMQAAKPVIEAQPAATNQMQMTKNIITATMPISDQDMPQPLKVSEEHLAGHSQPQPLVEQAPQTTVSIKTADPVAMPVAVQTTTQPMSTAVPPKAPTTLTPNVSGTITLQAIQQQLRNLQEHLTTVAQQIELMSTTQN